MARLPIKIGVKFQVFLFLKQVHEVATNVQKRCIQQHQDASKYMHDAGYPTALRCNMSINIQQRHLREFEKLQFKGKNFANFD